jgi:hypothetical protein
MSPRWSELIHELTDLRDDRAVSGVVPNSLRVGTHLFPSSLAGGVDERLPNGLRLRHALFHQPLERPLGLSVQTNGNRLLGHVG